MIDYTITSVEAYAEKGVPGLKFRAVVNPKTSDEELRQIVINAQEVLQTYPAMVLLVLIFVLPYLA